MYESVSIKGHYTFEIKSQLLADKQFSDVNSTAAFVKESCIFDQATRAGKHRHPLVQVEQTTSIVTMRALWLQQH